LCFSTASSRKTKKAASVNLQPLQSNLKVLQEQQTQRQYTIVSPFHKPTPSREPAEIASWSYDVTPDGMKFVIVSEARQLGFAPVTLITHWTELLKQK
jgi:hypothetical protein